jgi:hypothetical protein
MILTVTTEIEDNEEPIEVRVQAEFIPGSPGRKYMANGDPGYPDDPDEINILSVIGADGIEYNPSEGEVARMHVLLAIFGVRLGDDF